MLKTAEIKELIAEDKSSKKKQLAAVGQRYYEGDHDIKRYKMYYFNSDGKLVEDKYRSNTKICHPFFTLLSEQLASYVLSFKETPIIAKPTAEGLQEHLDSYFDSKFWDELGETVKGAYVKGFDYIYGYKVAENKMAFQYADGMGVVEVEARFASDKIPHVLYHYIDRIDKEGEVITKIQDWTETETYYYTQTGYSGDIEIDKDVEINPRPHIVYTDQKTGEKMGRPLGYIPFWRLDNNKKQVSGLKPIKPLIDDYDLHACALSNNLKDFDTPIYFVSGYPNDDLNELQTNLKTKKIVATDGEGGIDIKTVDIPYQARKEMLEIDERSIYKFAMGTNTAGLKDSNATTNIGIKAAFYDLDLKAGLMTKKVGGLLEEIVKVVLNEINTENGTDYQPSDVEYDFTRTTMTNETENIANDKIKAETKQIEVNTILNIAASVGDEQTLKAICDCMEWDFDEIKGQVEEMQKEQELSAAKAALAGTVIDDVQPSPPEPVE